MTYVLIPSTKTVPPALDPSYIFTIKSKVTGSTIGLNFNDRGQTGVNTKL